MSNIIQLKERISEKLGQDKFNVVKDSLEIIFNVLGDAFTESFLSDIIMLLETYNDKDLISNIFFEFLHLSLSLYYFKDIKLLDLIGNPDIDGISLLNEIQLTSFKLKKEIKTLRRVFGVSNEQE